MSDTPRLYSTVEAAAMLGIHPGHVRRLAVLLEVGRKVGHRSYIFTDADLDALRQRSTKKGPKPRIMTMVPSEAKE